MIQILHISNFSSFFTFIFVSSIILFLIVRIVLGRETKVKGDFWAHKKLAKSKIVWLNFIFFATLFLIFITAYGFFMLILLTIYHDAPQEHNIRIALNISIFIILIIVFAYFFKSIKMSKHSINALAKTLKASEISRFSKNLSSQDLMLLNVVEEMAIASSLRMPRVFVMKEEIGINAMCSGEKFGRYDEKIAIFVTKGALETFNRDELQGIIGHEFSHAFHRDVELNLKLFSIIFAITCIMIAGEVLFRITRRGTLGWPIIFFSLVCFMIGWLGSIFAQIIQSAISRQKEFLADASSVQYTRNPDGIKAALLKIMNLQQNSNIYIYKNQKS